MGCKYMYMYIYLYISETTRLVRGVAKLRGAARAMDLRKIHQMSSDLVSGQIFLSIH